MLSITGTIEAMFITTPIRKGSSNFFIFMSGRNHSRIIKLHCENWKC
jgi:hypothetical protein